VSFRAAVLAAVICALLGAGGCGESSGVEDGATVTAYVAAPLCAEAKQELEREGARAGELRVRLFCLEVTTPAGGTDQAPAGAGGLDLATVGANARRATEDSTAVGYLQAPGAAVRFSRPILEAAGIATVVDDSGTRAMNRLLDAIATADTGSLRQSVSDALE
jgi:hypothetical protein